MQVLLPGHLLLKFLKEQLEGCLEAFKAQVRRGQGPGSRVACALEPLLGVWDAWRPLRRR